MQTANIHLPEKLMETNVHSEPLMHLHVFGLREEAREPKENPCRHKENMQTCKLAGLNPEPSCCEVTAYTAPMCRPQAANIQLLFL